MGNGTKSDGVESAHQALRDDLAAADKDRDHYKERAIKAEDELVVNADIANNARDSVRRINAAEIALRRVCDTLGDPTPEELEQMESPPSTDNWSDWAMQRAGRVIAERDAHKEVREDYDSSLRLVQKRLGATHGETFPDFVERVAGELHTLRDEHGGVTAADVARVVNAGQPEQPMRTTYDVYGEQLTIDEIADRINDGTIPVPGYSAEVVDGGTLTLVENRVGTDPGERWDNTAGEVHLAVRNLKIVVRRGTGGTWVSTWHMDGDLCKVFVPDPPRR